MSPDPVLERERLLAARAVVPEHVVHRSFQAETVMLNLETGQYHGLNPVAGRMLSELERQPTVAAAAAVIGDEYGIAHEQIRDDLCELLGDLTRRGLVTLDLDPGA